MNDIVERLYPRLFGLAKHVAATATRELIEDLVQHMAACLLECKPGNTESWYLQHAAHRARDYLRHENRQPAAFTDTGYGVYGPETVRS